MGRPKSKEPKVDLAQEWTQSVRDAAFKEWIKSNQIKHIPIGVSAHPSNGPYSPHKKSKDPLIVLDEEE